MRTLLCFPQGHCGSSSRLGSYSRKSPSSLPAARRQQRVRAARGRTPPLWSGLLPPTCVQAALVAAGTAQTEAPVAGVTRLGEGRGGVDGVPPAPQHVGGIQELGVGDGLQTVRRQSCIYLCVASPPSPRTPPHLSVGAQLHSFQPDHHLLGADPSGRVPLARSFQFDIPNEHNDFRDFPTNDRTLSPPRQACGSRRQFASSSPTTTRRLEGDYSLKLQMVPPAAEKSGRIEPAS